MKFKLLLVLAVFTLANQATAAETASPAAVEAATSVVAQAADKTAEVAIQVAKEVAAVATPVTDKVVKFATPVVEATASVFARTKAFVTSLPETVKAKYTEISESKCVQAHVQYVQAHKKAVIAAAAVVVVGAAVYAAYKSKQAKNKNN